MSPYFLGMLGIAVVTLVVFMLAIWMDDTENRR